MISLPSIRTNQAGSLLLDSESQIRPSFFMQCFSRLPFSRRIAGILMSAAVAATVSALPAQVQASPASDADALLAKMNLDEKIGQMMQVDMVALKDKSDVGKYCLGSVLSGGGSDPADNLPQTWLKAVMEFREQALQTRLKIPLIYGIDAVHGHNNILGAVIFPHHVGLGATHDPDLVEKAERVTAEEVAGTGIRWAFAPCIAVSREDRKS